MGLFKRILQALNAPDVKDLIYRKDVGGLMRALDYPRIEYGIVARKALRKTWREFPGVQESLSRFAERLRQSRKKLAEQWWKSSEYRSWICDAWPATTCTKWIEAEDGFLLEWFEVLDSHRFLRHMAELVAECLARGPDLRFGENRFVSQILQVPEFDPFRGVAYIDPFARRCSYPRYSTIAGDH